MFHLLFRIIDCIIYSIRKKGREQAPLKALRPLVLPESRTHAPSVRRGRRKSTGISLFSPISPSQKRMPFGILSSLFIGMFLLIHPMRHTTADQQKEQQDETRAVFLKINEIMSQDHLDHDRGDLSDERRLEMLLR